MRETKTNQMSRVLVFERNCMVRDLDSLAEELAWRAAPSGILRVLNPALRSLEGARRTVLRARGQIANLKPRFGSGESVLMEIEYRAGILKDASQLDAVTQSRLVTQAKRSGVLKECKDGERRHQIQRLLGMEEA